MSEPVAPSGRRAALRRQRRRRRVRLIAVAVGLLAAIAVGFAVYLGARDVPEPMASQPPTERMQTTLSLQIQGPNGAGVANALLAHDPATKTGSVILIPPRCW